jgi:hypothetical protein
VEFLHYLLNCANDALADPAERGEADL